MRTHRTSAEARLQVVASLGLPPDTRSAARARRFVGDFCASARLPTGVGETAPLLASELVTNAVLHGRTRAVIEATLSAGVLRVAVRDEGRGRPAMDAYPGLAAEGGRGLLIVSKLSTRWGVEPDADGGKAVWFELDV